MKTWKTRKGDLTSKSRPVKSDGEYDEDRAYNYLWELINLGDFIPAFAGFRIFKDGFARYTYKRGNFCGVEARIKQTLADMERDLGIERGTLKARIHYAKVGNFADTLAAEQFFHKGNFASRIAGLFYDQRTGKLRRPFGGVSEFYNMDEVTAKAKFANSWNRSKLAIGTEIVTEKRANGEHGVPTPDLPNYEEGL
jgi:hypothetical protein|tara:strand:+ start:170 stop:757 length:588 start_codon:yes stop_codon:yes gene_type:complete